MLCNYLEELGLCYKISFKIKTIKNSTKFLRIQKKKPKFIPDFPKLIYPVNIRYHIKQPTHTHTVILCCLCLACCQAKYLTVCLLLKASLSGRVKLIELTFQPRCVAREKG